MKFKVLVLSAVLAVSLSACSKERKVANSFSDFYEQQTGQKLVVEKLFTLQPGVVVFKNKSTGEYVAFNTSKFDANSQTTMAAYLAAASAPGDVVHNLSERSVTTSYSTYHDGYWTYSDDPVYDMNGNQTGYTRHDYYVEGYYTTDYSTTYYYDGGGFTFAEANTQNKDLDAIANSVETANNAEVANSIVSKFGLSEDRAETLANLAVNYARLENSRRLTGADKEVFAKKALNVSYGDLESAYRASAQGNATQYNTLIGQAAQFNGMSPEKARTLMDTYFTSESAN
jgi:hypothetical protein